MNLLPGQRFGYVLGNTRRHARNVKRLNKIDRLYNEYCYYQYHNSETKQVLSQLLNNDLSNMVLSYLPLNNLKTILAKLQVDQI